MFSAVEPSVTRPCWRRSSGTKAMPALIAARGLFRAMRLTVEQHRTLVVSIDAEDGASDLTPTGADEPGESDDLAGSNLEA